MFNLRCSIFDLQSLALRLSSFTFDALFFDVGVWVCGPYVGLEPQVALLMSLQLGCLESVVFSLSSLSFHLSSFMSLVVRCWRWCMAWQDPPLKPQVDQLQRRVAHGPEACV